MAQRINDTVDGVACNILNWTYMMSWCVLAELYVVNNRMPWTHRKSVVVFGQWHSVWHTYNKHTHNLTRHDDDDVESVYGHFGGYKNNSGLMSIAVVDDTDMI